MTASESALVSSIRHLEVDPNTAFNTPTTGTPIPMSKMSSETLAVLDEAASKLKILRISQPKESREREVAPSQETDNPQAETDTHLSLSLCT